MGKEGSRKGLLNSFIFLSMDLSILCDSPLDDASFAGVGCIFSSSPPTCGATST